MYDFVKDHIHRKRVTPAQEELLLAELKTAVQVIDRDIPEDIVKVGSRVSIKDHTLGTEKEYQFVGVGKSKPSKGKYAIDSSIGLATLGRKEGSIFDWSFKDITSKIEILSVEKAV